MKQTLAIAILTAVGAGSAIPSAEAAEAPPSAPAAAPARCGELTGLRLAGTSIESAALVPAKPAETSIAGEAPGYRLLRVFAQGA